MIKCFYAPLSKIKLIFTFVTLLYEIIPVIFTSSYNQKQLLTQEIKILTYTSLAKDNSTKTARHHRNNIRFDIKSMRY